MDPVIDAAAGALASGDPLGALNRVALRNDAAALALRGIAMAQIGDLPRARSLVRAAARAFGPEAGVERARCAVAEAEIALALRDLTHPTLPLDTAADALDRGGDRLNAAYARYLAARRLLLIGRVEDAARAAGVLDAAALPAAFRAAHGLVVAGIAVRRLRAGEARAALALAQRDARRAGVPALLAEVEAAALVLETPAARLVARGGERLLKLDEVERVMATDAVIVDASRYAVRHEGRAVVLASRPVLFALARSLATAWPGDAPREALLAEAFHARHADESHRARLRVEIGRLRKALEGIADITATRRGFRLSAPGAAEVVVLAPPADDEHAAVLALLADGELWSSSALALALGVSQRTAQRALDTLASAGKVQSVGRARARRWMTPPTPGFPTSLLLPALLLGR
ncbi:helix-turn-helix domain-containing protein [Acuticoccus sediminis]|uniref:Helix-turn-helix domain-containing protein n=1 Tax=Acuticoccus sediminis TaxID=2184697 RepID=A0A8B2NST5_9HYPH|nr:HTH domain-containing protein [Acuticoccus sediminis]RAI03268.1 helix-turn-helix domain-containing protein [Acuticoccus sediminis]